jgi:SET domain-containing protein
MDEKIIIKKSKHGKGVFAARDIKKGEKIQEFTGNIIDYDDFPKDYDPENDHYVQVDKRKYMGPSGNADDIFNHSCDPNAGLRINKEVFLVAIKDIKKGDEITWDYSTTRDEDEWEMNCSCGSIICRKKVRDFKYLPREIQLRYKKLGIIPKWILKRYDKKD